MGSRGAKEQTIIAMKGLPCTGKSTLAKSLAQSIRYPIIAQDTIHQCLSSLHKSFTPQHLDGLSFDATCHIIFRQQKLGHSLIFDSPLSSPAQLTHLSKICSSSGYSIVIIECVSRDKYLWQQRFEQRDDATWRWCKPFDWYDLVKRMKSDDRYSDYDTRDVPKIVVDTTGHVEVRELAFAISTLIRAASTQPCSINYDEFVSGLRRGIVLTQRNENEEREREKYMDYSHLHVFQFCEDGNDTSIDCRACLEPISGSTYVCNVCSLALHKSCAELPHRTQIKPHDLPNFLQATPQQYSFPEIIRCSNCKSSNKDFKNCHQCLFESYIQCRLLPTILHHPCHDHPLHVKTMPVSSSYAYICRACGDPGNHICYFCYECDFECHLGCGLLPHMGKQEHHLHNLTVTSLTVRGYLEELCGACETYRNPNHWVYYCEECEFASHLRCMNFPDESDPV